MHSLTLRQWVVLWVVGAVFSRVDAAETVKVSLLDPKQYDLPAVNFQPPPVASIDRALASDDFSLCAQALDELMQPRYAREDAINALKRYVNHRSANVRVMVAGMLFQLGSDAGRGGLVSVLEAVARGETVVGSLAAQAAQVLHQYRQPIPAGLLQAAYERAPSVSLKQYLVLQGDPVAKDLVAEGFRKNEFPVSQAIYAGILRMNDETTLARLREMLAGNAEMRAAAHWALYRASGSEADLAYLVGLARQHAGLAVRTPDIGNNAGSDAMKYLEIDAHPLSTAALREIVEGTQAVNNSQAFSSAFAALFYIHQDYDYIDGKLKAYLSGSPGPKGAPVIWEVAAARQSPEIAALALARNRTAYQQYFMLRGGYPPEGWIYQYITINVSVNAFRTAQLSRR